MLQSADNHLLYYATYTKQMNSDQGTELMQNLLDKYSFTMLPREMLGGEAKILTQDS